MDSVLFLNFSKDHLTSDSPVNQAKIPVSYFTTKSGNGLNKKTATPRKARRTQECYRRSGKKLRSKMEKNSSTGCKEHALKMKKRKKGYGLKC